MIDQKIFVIILSLIWGLGLALIFKKTCIDDNCHVIKVSPLFNHKTNVIKDRNNICYRLEPYYIDC